MSLVKEFKEFIVKGNVVDLAVGVIIGAAFGKIVTSLVEDIITPVLLNPAMKAAGVDKIEDWRPGGVLAGKFLAAVIGFLVIAMVIFLLVKLVNSLKKGKDIEIAPTTSESLLIEIRDLLAKKN
jgi:large conductance mechanosensitive channel